jgi:hypothetical protein
MAALCVVGGFAFFWLESLQTLDLEVNDIGSL